ncbi:hypothetical protein PCL_03984 [Purpureocillium lilacinum]|uniref:Uncharacterized protein n=1 Tax=Purpureocillium lilacinum TaxID=33203 RepID=A0A2U3EQM2_PURLI|nr:hypothetical protein Purlil1_3474 [Purpureocillium lilacinum]PWI76790.1 hypothetical protein PCL_03984 [Purpureocillium lilacinum]
MGVRPGRRGEKKKKVEERVGEHASRRDRLASSLRRGEERKQAGEEDRRLQEEGRSVAAAPAGGDGWHEVGVVYRQNYTSGLGWLGWVLSPYLATKKSLPNYDCKAADDEQQHQEQQHGQPSTSRRRPLACAARLHPKKWTTPVLQQADVCFVGPLLGTLPDQIQTGTRRRRRPGGTTDARARAYQGHRHDEPAVISGPCGLPCAFGPIPGGPKGALCLKICADFFLGHVGVVREARMSGPKPEAVTGEAREDATRAALRGGGGANKVPDEAKREAPLQPPFDDDD